MEKPGLTYVLPKVSIITVVYNDEKLIELTLQSVKRQTYPNIEYIVIDGFSTDNTLEIIKKYESILTILLSEPDKGLYDAMNKGLNRAAGDYVCFINSGDQFYSDTTLEEVFGKLLTLPDLIYGETSIIMPNGNEIGLRRLKAPDVLTWRSFKNGMVVCHQSVYVRRNIAENYDLNYKIASDFKWVLQALKKAKSIYNSKLILTKFIDGGLSKNNIRRALIERFKIMVENYGLFPTLFRHFIIGLKFFRFYYKNKRF
jgi:glycosyltransferase involved in cell wall biosynthesis